MMLLWVAGIICVSSCAIALFMLWEEWKRMKNEGFIEFNTITALVLSILVSGVVIIVNCVSRIVS